MAETRNEDWRPNFQRIALLNSTRQASPNPFLFLQVVVAVSIDSLFTMLHVRNIKMLDTHQPQVYTGERHGLQQLGSVCSLEGHQL